jgi:Protein of Unknown function (DUF2784)
MLADAVLLLHFAIVLFVVFGALAIVLGGWRGWDRTRGWGFRGLHALAIAVVVLQSWLGQQCPLTLLETRLRAQAGQGGYGAQGFIEHWVSRLMYFDAPPWAFVLAYTVFAALVAAAWWRWPPRRRTAKRSP